MFVNLIFEWLENVYCTAIDDFSCKHWGSLTVDMQCKPFPHPSPPGRLYNWQSKNWHSRNRNSTQHSLLRLPPPKHRVHEAKISIIYYFVYRTMLPWVTRQYVASSSNTHTHTETITVHTRGVKRTIKPTGGCLLQAPRKQGEPQPATKQIKTRPTCNGAVHRSTAYQFTVAWLCVCVCSRSNSVVVKLCIVGPAWQRGRGDTRLSQQQQQQNTAVSIHLRFGGGAHAARHTPSLMQPAPQPHTQTHVFTNNCMTVGPEFDGLIGFFCLCCYAPVLFIARCWLTWHYSLCRSA